MRARKNQPWVGNSDVNAKSSIFTIYKISLDTVIIRSYQVKKAEMFFDWFAGKNLKNYKDLIREAENRLKGFIHRLLSIKVICRFSNLCDIFFRRPPGGFYAIGGRRKKSKYNGHFQKWNIDYERVLCSKFNGFYSDNRRLKQYWKALVISPFVSFTPTIGDWNALCRRLSLSRFQVLLRQ